ncbi:hypothetical protein Tco_0661541 [Tanacetum coccineum]
MKFEYIHSDGDIFMDYSWEKALYISGDVYREWLEVDDKLFNHEAYWQKIGTPTSSNPRTSLIKEPLMRVVHRLLVGSLVHRVGRKGENIDWGNEGHGVYKKIEGDGSCHTKYEVITSSGRKFTRGFKMKETKRKLSEKFTSEDILKLQGKGFGTPRVADWNLFYSYNFEETLRNKMKFEYIHSDGNVFVDYSWERALSISGDAFWIEKVLTLLEFAVLLGLYEEEESNHRLFDIHFTRLEVDDKLFNHEAFWQKIRTPTREESKKGYVDNERIRGVTGINLAWVIVEHLCKHASGLKENSLICGGSIVPSSCYEIGGSSAGFHGDNDFDPIVHSDDCVASDNDDDDMRD